jgi:hypothetical protein
VTDPSVGSGALFGSGGTWMTGLKKNVILSVISIIDGGVFEIIKCGHDDRW